MNKLKILKGIRETAIIIFMISTLFPGLSTKIIAIPAILVWLLTNFLIDKKVFIDFFIKPNLLMYSIYFWIITNIIYVITGYSPQLSTYLITYIRIAITAIIYLYYQKYEDNKSLRIIMLASLITITIVNIITIIANINTPGISRKYTGVIALEHIEFGVGSYPHIYGLIYPVLIIIAYIISSIKHHKNKVIIRNVKVDTNINKFEKTKKTEFKKINHKMIFTILFSIIFVIISIY